MIGFKQLFVICFRCLGRLKIGRQLVKLEKLLGKLSLAQPQAVAVDVCDGPKAAVKRSSILLLELI